jgi:hypothetical protein
LPWKPTGILSQKLITKLIHKLYRNKFMSKEEMLGVFVNDNFSVEKEIEDNA